MPPRERITPARRIVAYGGGGFSMERDNTLLDDHILELPGVERPRICFLPTASGDADHYIVRFYRAFAAGRCEPSHISLFRRDGGPADIHEHIRASDIVYVGGGNVVSLLGTWRAHGLDETLREAWNAGVVMCGVSAGSLCWFDSAVTAFHGEARAVQGLGLLPWSNCVHYDCEEKRDRGYRRMLSEGMCAGYAAEDGTALEFSGTRLTRVIGSREGAHAYRMSCRGGRIVRTPLATTFLGALAVAA
jgi:peptidase E